MSTEEGRPDLAADETGIHFLRSACEGRGHPMVYWGEIDQVCSLRWKQADGTTFLEIYLDHYSGVDFRFQNGDSGYEQVMAEMEKHLLGFLQARVEAVGTWDEEQDLPVVVWRRDEAVQSFELRPPSVP
jgi:hypothetical protein